VVGLHLDGRKTIIALITRLGNYFDPSAGMHPGKASVSMFDNAVVVSISCVACQTPSISSDAEIIQAWLGRHGVLLCGRVVKCMKNVRGMWTFERVTNDLKHLAVNDPDGQKADKHG